MPACLSVSRTGPSPVSCEYCNLFRVAAEAIEEAPEGCSNEDVMELFSRVNLQL